MNLQECTPQNVPTPSSQKLPRDLAWIFQWEHQWKGLNQFRKVLETLLCQSSAVVASSFYSVTSLKQLPLVLLPCGNQACAKMVLQMLSYSQKVKKRASFHSERAPCQLHEDQEGQVVLSLCHSCRQRTAAASAFWFQCITWKFKEDPVYFCFLFTLLSKTTSIFSCHDEATGYFLQNASLGIRLIQVGSW